MALSERIGAELAAYEAAYPCRDAKKPLFALQRAEGFTANPLTHIVSGIYRNAGVDGATSHSGRRGFMTRLSEKGISNGMDAPVSRSCRDHLR